jgi:hypothetical protein
MIKFKRVIKKLYISYLRNYASNWVCEYKTNLTAFKKGKIFCPQRKYEEAENYALANTTMFPLHVNVKLSFRKSNFIDHLVR